jgi:hypothetical protein
VSAPRDILPGLFVSVLSDIKRIHTIGKVVLQAATRNNTMVAARIDFGKPMI